MFTLKNTWLHTKAVCYAHLNVATTNKQLRRQFYLFRSLMLRLSCIYCYSVTYVSHCCGWLISLIAISFAQMKNCCDFCRLSYWLQSKDEAVSADIELITDGLKFTVWKPRPRKQIVIRESFETNFNKLTCKNNFFTRLIDFIKVEIADTSCNRFLRKHIIFFIFHILSCTSSFI